MRWLWGAVALAAGLFMGRGGILTWALAAAVALAGLAGLVRRKRWAAVTLWVGGGLCLGLCLHLVLELALPERAAYFQLPALS